MEKENTATLDQVTSEEVGSFADFQLPIANCQLPIRLFNDRELFAEAIGIIFQFLLSRCELFRRPPPT